MTCPEGRRCSWCGPSARAARDVERAAVVESEMPGLVEETRWECVFDEVPALTELLPCGTAPLRVPLLEMARVRA